MRTVLFLVGFLATIQVASLSRVPPYEIPFSKAESYGIELKRVSGEEKTVIYLSFDERKFCPVKSVQLNEKYMTVGEQKRYLSRHGDVFTTSFRNAQEYDEIRFIIICSEWHKKIPTDLFSLVIAGQDA